MLWFGVAQHEMCLVEIQLRLADPLLQNTAEDRDLYTITSTTTAYPTQAKGNTRNSLRDN